MTKNSSFPQLEGLLDLACRNGVDVRPTLLRVLTDLFVQKRTHSAAEVGQFVELALRLVESVDAPTRAAVAVRLMSYPGAPAALLDRLAVLTGYTVTPPLERPPASEPAAAAHDNELAELFLRADSEERRLILTNLDVAYATAGIAAPQAAVACLELEKAAFAHDPNAFAATLARALDIAPALAQRLTEDTAGEPLVIMARVLAMPAAMFQRILLFINPKIGQSVRRVYELANLYDEISPQAAHAMLDIWRGEAAARRPTHHSVYHDDERKSARAAATPSRYRSARRSDSLAARFKTSGR